VLSDVDFALLFCWAVSLLGAYGVIAAGWASNSKYAFFGAVRSCSQLIAYEVSIGVLTWPALMLCGSLSLVAVVGQQETIANACA